MASTSELGLPLSQHSSLTAELVLPSLMDGIATQVLSNETHWRIYENAERVGQILTSALQHANFSMQDFLGHVGTHCHFVSITCRNEVSSFRIFSTINSRGQELSVVDKIKAEMFQQLPEGRRAELADR